jgi:hypothetical protein
MACAVLAAAVAGVSLWPGPALAQAQNAAQKEKRADQTNVPVKVVVLFSSGVGYFEHAGAVTGNASSELRFKTQQINDILKSLVLQDMGGGRVTTVVYPSQDPIEKTLRSFQVDITGDPSLAELLSQLRGAKVQLTLGGEQVGGTILGLEKKPKSVGGKDESGEPKAIETWWINLISGGTIRSIELADARKIDLEDPQLQEELSQALTALAQARDQDKKPVTIQFSGQGERQVRIGYVVETPIWKTSYRLVLPGQGAAGEKKEGQPEQAAADKPKLVGWAIVENQTDNDWNNVQLSLVSGRPISFIQNLYSPLYVPRPVVQPELYASLRPQTYDAGMEGVERLAEAEANAPAEPADAAKRQRGARAGLEAATARPPAAPAPTGGAAMQQMAQQMDYRRADNFAASVASVASASKVGELFQYTVGNVNLPRQRSAMIPIVTDDIEVEKLSIYNQSVLARHPLNGARVKNTTGKHLLQGPITVLEGSGYAGDARIDNVPPGQERLISYGIDLQMLVDAKNHKSEAAVVAGKIVKGVLWVTRKNVASQEYHAENKSEKDKTLVIEHPLRGGWTLVEPGKPAEKTETLYRFRQGVAAGKQAVVRVVEENVASQQIAILPQDVAALTTYARTDNIPKEVKDALNKAITLKNTMAGTQREIDRRRKELADITQEQTRIRENLKTVARDNEYADRLLKKLNEQESRIETLQKEVDDLQKAFENQRKELEDYLAATTIG